jgi:hypothetical protein
MTRLLGDQPLKNAGTVVGQHLKNFATGVASTITAPPNGTEEKVASYLGPGALQMDRAFVQPTVSALREAGTQYKAGNIAGEPYGSDNKYKPSVASSLMDAVPVAGPWARSIENDAQTYGAVPSLLGLGTDMLAPKVAGSVGASAIRGGAQVARLASANLPSQSLWATRLLTNGTPGELLQSALKPGVKYGAGAGDMLQQSLPDVLAQDPKLQGVSGFAKASDAARDASFHPYNDLIAPYRAPVPFDDALGKVLPGVAQGPVRPSLINGNPIADAQMSSVPTMDRIEQPARLVPGNPGRMKTVTVPAGEGTKLSMGGFVGSTSDSIEGGIMNRTANVADNYRKDMSVPVLDAVRGDANGKLNAFYGKAHGDRAAALSNPETARVKAVGDSTRGVLYPQLESDAALAPGSVDAMQAKYGLLSDTSDIANKREPVFARHDPVTLSQKIVAGHGNPLSMAWNYAIQKGLTKLTNSDALVNSAVDRFQNPTETPLNPRPGLFAQSAMSTGNALRKLPTPKLGYNPLFYAPKDTSR